MIDINKFIKSLKSTWIRRLLKDSDAPWAHLINYRLNVSHKLTIFGPAWCRKLIAKITNPFWKNVLDSWQEVSESCSIMCLNDIIFSPLWFNKSLSEYDIFESEWYEHGIRYIGDLLSETGNILSREELQRMYNLRNINILDYYRIKLLVRSFMNKYAQVTNENCARVVGPFIPFHVKILFKSQKGAGDIYKMLNNSSYEPKMKNKWNHELNIEIDERTWQNIFKICFRFSCDASLTWLQYRILYRIIGVRKYLSVICKDNSDICRLCATEQESIEHLFFHCSQTNQLWCSITNWIKLKMGITHVFNIREVPFGYMYSDSYYEPMNLLILSAKNYIFHCALNYRKLNFYAFQKLFKDKYLEQLTLSKLKATEQIFTKKWKLCKSLFQDIELP